MQYLDRDNSMPRLHITLKACQPGCAFYDYNKFRPPNPLFEPMIFRKYAGKSRAPQRGSYCGAIRNMQFSVRIVAEKPTFRI